MTSQDPTQVKETVRQEWQQAAPAWRKYDDLLRRFAAPVSEAMLDAAALAPGMRVIDVAGGTGEPAIQAAARVAPGGQVLSTDLADEMLEVARDRARAEGVDNVEFRIADGEELPVGDGEFDALTCRFGIMFMPRPERFASEAYRVLKPGCRAVVAVWGPPQENPGISLAMMVAARYTHVSPPPPGAPGVFSFADPERLRSVLAGAGFNDVTINDVPVAFAGIDSGREYWTYISEFAPPVRSLIESLPPDVREKVGEEVAREAGGGDPDGPVSLPGRAMVGWGTK